MLAGIVFQMGKILALFDQLNDSDRDRLAAITVYVALASEFILRYIYDKPVRQVKTENYGDSEDTPLDKKTKLMLLSLALSSLFIFIR